MGKIELDHTGSGSGITLSSDGTDLLLDGTAIGGGGAALELYAENPSSPTAPSATGGNAVAIGSGASATNLHAISIGRNTTATGIYALSLNGNATPTYSAAIGYSSAGSRATTAVGQGSHAFGGSYASGTDSFAAAIANNTSSYGATGANSVAIGQLAKATGANGLALGRDTEATATQAVAVGRNVVASGSFSAAFGTDSTASASYSTVIGHQGVSDIIGKIVFAGGYDFSANGDVQQGLFILRSDTTDATAEALTTSNSTAGTTNQIILPNNSVYGFTGTVIAREDSSSTDDFAVWEIKGGAVRGANAASTTLGSYNINKISESTGASNWSIALSADTTNGAVAITVTGEAAHNIRWVATVNTTEVTY